MIKISLLHASRQRPVKSFEACHQWLMNAKNIKNIEYILSLDTDDPCLMDYQRLWDDLNIPNSQLLINDNRSLVDAANAAAEASKGDLIILMSDDFESPKDWDELLLKELKGKEDYLVRTFDGVQKWLITLPIMDRKYYNRFGYIYHPSYYHLFVDASQTHVGELLGRIVNVPLTFEHKHYTTGKTQKDALNARNDASWASGEAIYIGQVKNNFGLSKEQIVGQVTNQEHIEYLKSKGVRI